MGEEFLNHSNMEAVPNKRQPGDSPRTIKHKINKHKVTITLTQHTIEQSTKVATYLRRVDDDDDEDSNEYDDGDDDDDDEYNVELVYINANGFLSYKSN